MQQAGTATTPPRKPLATAYMSMRLYRLYLEWVKAGRPKAKR